MKSDQRTFAWAALSTAPAIHACQQALRNRNSQLAATPPWFNAASPHSVVSHYSDKTQEEGPAEFDIKSLKPPIYCPQSNRPPDYIRRLQFLTIGESTIQDSLF